MKSVRARIIEVMIEVLEVPKNEISDTSSTDSIESWDSLRHLNLILALEEEFSVNIPDEEVGNLVNLPLIEVVINEQLNKLSL